MEEIKISYDNIYSVSERKELIADSLKTYRKIMKLTQSQVAEKIGISQQTYATYERGRNEPPAEILVRISFLYNIPVDVLVQRNNMEKDKKSFERQLNEFDAVIEETKKRILSGDPETRKQLQMLTESIKQITEAIRKGGL